MASPAYAGGIWPCIKMIIKPVVVMRAMLTISSLTASQRIAQLNK